MIAPLKLILVNVSMAALAVAVFQTLLGWSPLILFVVPSVVVFRVSGFTAAVVAAVVGAVVGDFFFVAPVGQITVHAEGRRLLLLLLFGTALLPFVLPRTSIPKNHN
jgi:K+-sensing histidine kinase KdpD